MYLCFNIIFTEISESIYRKYELNKSDHNVYLYILEWYSTEHLNGNSIMILKTHFNIFYNNNIKNDFIKH